MQINIIYWSGTGNTKSIAELIKEGALDAGASVALWNVADIDAETALSADVLALGCPAMGAEELEDGEFEPFIASIEENVGGKKMALFGSYDWGDGEWMRNWTARMENAGAALISESLIVNGAPDSESSRQCKEFGATIAK
jgi:flavodoxin short chain